MDSDRTKDVAGGSRARGQKTSGVEKSGCDVIMSIKGEAMGASVLQKNVVAVGRRYVQSRGRLGGGGGQHESDVLQARER